MVRRKLYGVLNAAKCLFTYLGKDTENETSIINNFNFNNSNEEKILRTTIENQLTFKSHIKILCKKAAQKIEALSRLLNHLNYFLKRLIFNSIIIIKSQFNFCPLIWMFSRRTSNNTINKIDERALRLILNDHTSNFMIERRNDTYNLRNFQELAMK